MVGTLDQYEDTVIATPELLDKYLEVCAKYNIEHASIEGVGSFGFRPKVYVPLPVEENKKEEEKAVTDEEILMNPYAGL